jgi:hypothetical protein
LVTGRDVIATAAIRAGKGESGLDLRTNSGLAAATTETPAELEVGALDEDLTLHGNFEVGNDCVVDVAADG